MRRPFGLFLAFTSLLMAAACGSSGGSASSTTDNNALPPDQLAEQAFAALSTATSFHIWGTLPEKRATAHIDMHLGTAGGYGAVRVHGQTVRIRTVDEQTYLRGTDTYYRKVLPAAKRATILPLLHGKWLHITQGSKQFFALASLTSIDVFRTRLPASASGDSYKSGGPKIVRGIPAASVIDQSEGSFIYFAETGTPYPLEIESGPFKLDFDSWNKPLTVSAPPASQVVHPSQLRR